MDYNGSVVHFHKLEGANQVLASFVRRVWLLHVYSTIVRRS